MRSTTKEDLEALLDAHEAGGRAGLDRLVELAYPQLRAIAHRELRRGRAGLMFDTTGLVNEAYLRLSRHDPKRWREPDHFFAAAARAMRHVLVDYARQRQTLKRGEAHIMFPFDDSQHGARVDFERVLDVDRVLRELAEVDERLVRVVECRYFGGLTEKETARALSVTVRTVQRDWRRARAWLRLKTAI